jgi:putative nucleotidyltransferase with HDIG domain
LPPHPRRRSRAKVHNQQRVMAIADLSRVRRDEIRKRTLAHTPPAGWRKLREQGGSASLLIAAGFFIIATLILMLRQGVMPYRPGQWISHDIVSRVRFAYSDPAQLESVQRDAADREPRVYRPVPNDIWNDLEQSLLALPDRMAQGGTDALPADLRDIFDAGSVTALRRYVSSEGHKAFARRVSAYIQELRDYRILAGGQKWPIYILAAEDRTDDIRARRDVKIDGEGVIAAERTFVPHSDDLRAILADVAQNHFLLALQPRIVDYSLSQLVPNYQLDPVATAEAQENARNSVSSDAGQRVYPADFVLVPRSKMVLDQQDWQLLKAENDQYLRSLKGSRWRAELGTALFALIMTIVISSYIVRYQPRIVTNHARAMAMAGLLLAMLLVNQLAGLSNLPLYLFGIAPTLLVAMILTIAYDQRFGLGMASMHATLATLALNEGVPFFIIIWVGVLLTCFLLDEIRTRSKLIEVGGAAALGMVVATAAAGLLAFDPWRFVLLNCLYAGWAGLTAGFIVLGILPFIERSFRITTGMTLLELADLSQPLLRRLAAEAPGTYTHSLQVATLSEAAAETIGANSLLCRVASYYHDIGKMNKADYFVENQSGGESRHLNLSPNVSLMIITGHVRDGVELAHEYNLPTSIVPFIQQHHGTTLVEFFYHQARSQHEQHQPDMPAISEHQFRYPGPKPKTREVAVVMLADAVESATRTLQEPNASRVETLVHDLAMKRLLDGQFDDCALTMRDLEQMERSMVKSLLAIYHGRIAYPSTAALASKDPPPPAARIA